MVVVVGGGHKNMASDGTDNDHEQVPLKNFH